MLLLAALFALCLQTHASIVNIADERQAKLVEPFLGTYVSHDQIGRERLLSVFTDEHGLHVWEMGGYPVFIWHDFSYALPLENRLRQEVRYGTGVRGIGGSLIRKKTHVTFAWEVVSPRHLLARVTETDADGRHMSVEERRLISDGTELHYLIERSYFRRRFYLFGEWVVDQGREIVRQNSVREAFTFVKVTPHPMSLEVLGELRRQRDQRLDAEFGNPSQVVADFGWEGYSVLEDIKTALAKISPESGSGTSATILQFPDRSKCERDL